MHLDEFMNRFSRFRKTSPNPVHHISIYIYICIFIFDFQYRGNQVTSHHTLPLHKKISINQLGISFMSICICIQVTHYYVFIKKSRRIQEQWHVPTLEKPGSQVSSPRNRKELQYLAEGFENWNTTGFHSMLFWCFGGLLRTGIRMDFAARIQEKDTSKAKD